MGSRRVVKTPTANGQVDGQTGGGKVEKTPTANLPTSRPAGSSPAWQQFAERLGPKTSPGDTEHCGYSTNPSYSAELMNLIKRYRLDDPRAQQWLATGHDPGHLDIGSSAHPAVGRLTDLAVKRFSDSNSEAGQAAKPIETRSASAA
jgi:hypothetical protein